MGEVLSTFEVNISWPDLTGWKKRFSLVDDNNVKYTGRLYWDEDDGYRVYWDDDKFPDMANRPEFEYVLDSISTNRDDIPQYGDLSDAGMDGA